MFIGTLLTDLQTAVTGQIEALGTTQSTILVAALGIVLGFVVFRLVKKGANKAA